MNCRRSRSFNVHCYSSPKQEGETEELAESHFPKASNDVICITMPNLSVEQLNVLLSLAHSSTTPLRSLGEAFKQSFLDTGLAFQTILCIRMLHEEGSTISASVQSQNETLVAYYLIVLLMGDDASSVHAKALLSVMLQGLEVQIKADCRKMELWRHRAARDGPMKKMNAADAATSDAMRVRLILKWFAFECLLQNAPKDRTAVQILSMEQLNAEQCLDEVAQRGGIQLKEAVMDLQRAAESRDAVSLGFPSARKVPADNGEYMKPMRLQPSAPPQLAISPSEVRILCAPSHSTLAAFDLTPHSPLWKETRELLVQASQKTLTQQQQQQLLHNMTQGSTARYVGLTPELFLYICRRNPQLAPPLFQVVPQHAASLCLRTVVEHKEIDPATVNAVVVRASSTIEPQVLSQYVSTALSRVDENGSSASEVAAGLALTLQQLCIKGPHKLSTSDKSRLARRFLDLKGEGAVLWTELLSVQPQIAASPPTS